MATQNINIVISSTGGVTVIRNIQQIGQAAQAAINPLKALQNQINAIMGALAIGQIAEWADEWTSAANKIAVFSKSQEEANQVLETLYNVAQKVGQPLNAVVDLYHKLSLQSKALGVSVEDNIRVTEIVSKALTIQGTSAASAKGALLQLSQAFGTGKVKAQEYNSLLTGLPLVLKIAAENIKAAGGSVAKLTAMQRAGALSSKELYDAILKGGGDVDALFGSMNRTFAQGMTVLSNGLSKFFGEINASYGISNKFYEFTKFLVDNLGTIVKLLGIMAVAVAAAFAPAIVMGFANALGAAALALGRITALLLTNPFVLIATAVAAVYAFGDAWDAGLDGMTTVKDLMRALVEFIIEGFDQIAILAGTVWNTMVEYAQVAYDFISGETKKATGTWAKDYADFFEDTGTGWAGVVMKVAKVVDAIAGLITGIIMFIIRAFEDLPGTIENIFKQVYNGIATWMEKSVNTIIDGINTIRSKTGGAMIESVNFEKLKVDKSGAKSYGTILSESIEAGFDQQGGFMQKAAKGLFDRAQAIGEARRREAAANKKNPLDLSERTDPENIAQKGKKGKKDNSLEKLQNELRTLLNRIDPASGALLEMAKAQDILTKSVERGLITEQERQKYLPLLEQHYKDIINPLGKYNREIQEQIDLSQIAARERNIEATLMKTKQDLLMKGQPMTDQQISDMRTLLQLQRDMNEAAAARDQLVSGSSAEDARKFSVQLEEIKKLKAGGQFGQTDATNALQGGNSELFAGTQEAMDLRVQQFQDMYLRIDQMRQAEMISEQTASQMRLKVWSMESEMRLSGISSMFGQMASLQTSSNRKLAAVGKAAAVTQATIDGVLAVQKALASSPPPMNYVMAAAVGVTAAANVAKIMSANAAFATGGEFQVGGSGGVDSQMVAFRASPGEQVSVSTPTQVRKGTAGKSDGGSTAQAPVTFNPRIVNLVDPALLGDYLNTPEGDQLLVNAIRRNSDSVRQAVNNG